MHLGLPNSESADDALFEHNFSDDVLRIQIRTPYVEDLHIVDLPGVAHSEYGASMDNYKKLTKL